ncbi:MAG: zinc-binding alcohol dehydrogenase family protein [Phycisphaerae bacterium]|nr:zinc-binding alcohol dehydrogenase family protein [Phycisphaerae bacterium]MDW8261004.1 zinc-binding alcohol dehydrogenase family protein [Phycisphaerales bacterium]
MKAWLLDRLGEGIGTLRIGEIPDPQPAAGEVVLDLAYAAINPADRYLAEAQYPAKPSLPHILGRDGVGTVSALGPGVEGIGVGEKRIIVRSEIGVNRPGTFAERVAVPVESLVPVPAGWSDSEAAGATLVYLTAWQALTQWTDLPEPAVVLVSGASGGVGLAVTQLADAAGHTVIGLSRSSEKSAELLKQGATFTLDPNDRDWVRKLKDLLGNRRVDLAVDNIGGETFNQMIDTLGQNGRVSCVGRLAGPVPQFNTASLFFRRIQIRGVAVYSYRAAESAAIWPQIVQRLARRNYRPRVDSVYDFDKLPVAFARLAAGPMGKVLIRIRGTECRPTGR